MADYSIAWHVYLERKENSVKIQKTTYSILQTIKENSLDYKIRSQPLYDLYMQSTELQKKDILENANIISLAFCQKPINIMKPEFLI